MIKPRAFINEASVPLLKSSVIGAYGKADGYHNLPLFSLPEYHSDQCVTPDRRITFDGCNHLVWSEDHTQLICIVAEKEIAKQVLQIQSEGKVKAIDNELALALSTVAAVAILVLAFIALEIKKVETEIQFEAVTHCHIGGSYESTNTSGSTL